MRWRLLFLLPLCSASWLAWAAPAPTLTEIVRALRESRQKLDFCTFDFQCDRYRFTDLQKVMGPPLSLPPQPGRRHAGHYQSDPQHKELAYDTEYFIDDRVTRGPRLEISWDGHNLWHKYLPTSTDLECPNLSLANEPNGLEQILDDPVLGAMLDGKIQISEHENLLDQIEKRRTGKIETDPKNGEIHLTLKLDTVSGMLICNSAGNQLIGFDLKFQARRRRAARRFLDKLQGVPPAKTSQRRLFDVQFENIGGVDFPVAGKMLTSFSDAKGAHSSHELFVFQRRSVQLNPTALTSQTLLARENGSIWNQGANSVPKIWENGRLVRYFNPKVAEKINEALKELAGGSRDRAPALGKFDGSSGQPANITMASPKNQQSEEVCAPQEDYTTPFYAFYLLARLAGDTTTPTQFLERVGAPEIKSAKDLLPIARKAGLHARAVSNLSLHGLTNSPYPILLNTRSVIYDNRFASWKLFLGIRDHKAVVFTPDEGLHDENIDEVIAQWNGSGLAIGTAPVRLALLRRGEVAWFGAEALLLCIAVLFIRRWARGRGSARLDLSRSKRFRFAWGEFAAFCGVAVLVAILWNSLDPQGLLRMSKARENIRLTHAGTLVPSLSRAEVSELLSNPQPDTVIDARDPQSYYVGHIPGAINVPISVGESQLHKAMAGLTFDSPLVIYCSRASCKIADHMISRLAGEGYRRLRIYRGGWEDWSQQSQLETTE